MTQSSRMGHTARIATMSALALCLTGTLAACGSNAATSANTSPEDFHARIVYVETRPDSYQENGAWKGLTADAVHAVLKKMGAEVKSETASEAAGVVPGLAAGRYDMVGSSFYMTAERCEQVLFSDPFVLVGEAMAYKTGLAEEPTNIDSLTANKDLRLGLVQGSAELKFTTAAGIPTSRITQYPDIASTVEALKGGRVDVIMLDSITLSHILKTTSGVADIKRSKAFIPVVNGKPASVENAIMFPKGQEKVVEAFNKAMAEMRSSGELAKIIIPYGVSEQEVIDAGKKTSEQVCAAG